MNTCNKYWYLTIAEIKCPILFLQGFKTKINIVNISHDVKFYDEYRK